jgi:DNA-nicking Smr family endonuclease
MSYQRADWTLWSSRYHGQVDKYLDEVQWIRNDIAFSRDEAEREAAQRRRPANFKDLSNELERAESFLENEKIPTRSYRQMWERRMEDVQSWDKKNLRRGRGQIRQFISRLRGCQSQAAQLRQLVERTRRELGL